jgi:AcrR family transcriptional regulator
MQDKAWRKDKGALIIEAAARVFASRGYNGTLMADIATEAGIGKGTIYEYFDSKEDLFFAVFEWFVRATETEAKVSIHALGGSASERLEALSDSLMKSWLQMLDMFSLVMEFWSASASSQLVSALIRDGMQRGEFRPEVDAESVAAALVGTWDALLLQAWFDDSFDPLNTARRFMSVLIRGLAAESDTVGIPK